MARDFPYYARNLGLWCQKSAPSQEYMLKRLVARWGVDGACELLGCRFADLARWRAGKKARRPVYRAIWFAYALTFRPEWLSSAFHVLTWGKWVRRQDVRAIPGAQERLEDGAGI